MRILLSVVVASLGLGGCASVQTTNLSADSISQVQGKTIARTVHEKPSFSAMTPGKGAFGALGAIAMIKAGNNLVLKHDIQDPADRLATQLQQKMQHAFAMQPAAQSALMTKSGDVSNLRQVAPQADLVLDVKTAGWGFAYDGFDFSHYVVNANMHVRLIDMNSGQVLASSQCSSPEVAKEDMPTHDQLMADDAALIKTKLAQIADYCAETLAGTVFAAAPGTRTVGLGED